MFGFLLAFFAAVCWGIAPLFGKIGLEDVNPLDGLAVRTVVTVFFVCGWVFASSGIDRIARFSLRSWLFLALEAFLATFAGDLGYYAAIKSGEIGHAALILAASPLITIWAGWYCLGEHISPIKIIGAVLIITGVILVGFEATS